MGLMGNSWVNCQTLGLKQKMMAHALSKVYTKQLVMDSLVTLLLIVPPERIEKTHVQHYIDDVSPIQVSNCSIYDWGLL